MARRMNYAFFVTRETKLRNHAGFYNATISEFPITLATGALRAYSPLLPAVQPLDRWRTTPTALRPEVYEALPTDR